MYRSVLRAAFHLNRKNAITETIINSRVIIAHFRRQSFQKIHSKRIIAAVKTIFVIQPRKLIIKPPVKQFCKREKRHCKPCFAAFSDMHDFAQIPRVRSPTFGALFVRYHPHERKVIHRSGMAYHFQPTVEKVVLLIRRFVFFLLFG